MEEWSRLLLFYVGAYIIQGWSQSAYDQVDELR